MIYTNNIDYGGTSMRLWHQSLLPYLDNRRILGQHRECCALRGRGWGKKSSVINYIYDEGPSWRVWVCTNELFEYDGVFFVGKSSTEPIQDSKVANSEELVVYLSNSADAQMQLQRILDSNTNVTEYELQYREKYCDVYIFY